MTLRGGLNQLPTVVDLRSRAATLLFVLNGDFRIVLRSAPLERGSVEANFDVHVQNDRLPAELESAVRELVRETQGDELRSRSTVVSAKFMLTVSALDGLYRDHSAVYVEPIRVRDAANTARVRFQLSHRETEVAQLLIGGSATAQIAKTLNIAEATVHEHVRNIARKCDARNRPEIVSRILGGL